MSEQEQDAIIGRAVKEYGETKRELAALKSKARTYGATLSVIAEALDSGTEPHRRYARLGDEQWRRGMDSYPPKETVAEIAREIRNAEDRLQQLRHTLKDLGYEPKDT